jgi:hypothetical protein
MYDDLKGGQVSNIPCMVESPVFMAEQFSWYICFGITIYLDQISRVFTRNIKDSLFYNVPENFSSIDEVFRSENRHGDQNFHVG